MRENSILWVLLGLVAAVAVAAIIKTAKVQSNQNYALHSIICFVEFREKSTLPPKQKQQALVFWGEALAKAHLAPCD